MLPLTLNKPIDWKIEYKIEKQVAHRSHHSFEQHFKKYTILHVAYAKISCLNGPVVFEKKEDEIASLHTDGWTDGQQVHQFE